MVDDGVEGALLVIKRPPPLNPGVRLSGYTVFQDLHQTRFANTRFTADHDHLPHPSFGLVPAPLHEGDFFVPADQWGQAARRGDVESVVSELRSGSSSQPRFDAVIVDPPRTGMSAEALDAVLPLQSPRLVYVSCDVATLARDSRKIVDAGYTIARADAFDLFPNTPHVETVVVFER